MSTEQINIDILYERTRVEIDDSLTLEQIFEKQEKNKITFKKLNLISNNLKKSSLEDFVGLIVRILKEKVPDIVKFEQVIFSSRYKFGTLQSIVRDRDIKNAVLETVFKNNKLFYEKLTFNFSSPQNIIPLKNTIIKNLEDKNPSIVENIISVKNSPIEQILIEPLYFSLIMNQDLATFKREN